MPQWNPNTKIILSWFPGNVDRNRPKAGNTFRTCYWPAPHISLRTASPAALLEQHFHHLPPHRVGQAS